MDEQSSVCNVGIIKLIQPYVTVNARAFIKPSFILGGIYTHDEGVIAIEADIICDVISGTDITTQVVSQVESIDPDGGIPENTVELNLETGSGINARDGKMFAVPADAGFGK